MRPTLLLVLLLLSACERNPHDPEAGSGPLELLVVSTRNDGFRHLYAISADGRASERLTYPPGEAFAGRWSPDGRRIVFVREMDVFAGSEGRIAGQIYVMNADGSNPVRLTNQPMYDDHPDWSPDGTRIVFSRHWSDDHRIYVMDAHGSNLVELVRSEWRHTEPRWSPDGRKIAFLSNRGSPSIWGGPHRLYLMDADGSNLVQLPAPDHVIRDVFTYDWSPEGNRIAFGYEHRIYAMNVSGAPQFTALTSASSHIDWMPVWSPDGRKIAFSSGREHPQGGLDVFLINADGTGLQNLTHSQGFGNVATAWRSAP